MKATCHFLLCQALLCTTVLAQQAPPATQRPDQGEVVLPSAEGWNAHLVFDALVGVWTVVTGKVHPEYGCPEIVALDDRGRCTVLRSYSGKWTPEPAIEDGKWLAPTVVGSLHEASTTAAILVGGASGRLWHLRPRAGGVFESRLVAEWRGEEIHTLVLGDLDLATPGREALVFLASGRVFRVDARSPDDEKLEVRELGAVPGRVREAIVVQTGDGRPHVIAVARAGFLASLRLRGTELEFRVLAKEAMGLGRIARAPSDSDLVLYVTRDDGVILRFEGKLDAVLGDGDDAVERQTLTRELVYAGPQGPRGIATGRFDEDPAVECLAIFGYSKQVELLTRKGRDAWRVATIFEDVDQGHWLTTCEVDGRNGTDELVASGYSGRVVLLSRPPGYGLQKGIPFVAPRPSKRIAAATARGEKAPLRVGLRARDGIGKDLSPLSYVGGFATKSMLYETLVKRDASGRIGPSLAARWQVSADGRRFDFFLREGARFHDGSLVTAEDVRLHFRRCLGLPEHDWLPANRLVTEVKAVSPTCVRFELAEPHALLDSLCAINPCAIVGPAARDREGRFVRPIGSGPFRFVEDIDGRSWRVASAGGGEVEVVGFSRGGAGPIAGLEGGGIDRFVGGWDEDLAQHGVDALARDRRFVVETAPGSSVVLLDYRGEGCTGKREVRTAIRDAIDRARLVDLVEGGRADPTSQLMANTLTWWPRNEASVLAAVSTGGSAAPALQVDVRVRPGRRARSERAARAVVDQLQQAGMRAVLVPSNAKDADVHVNVTLGLPYDPIDALARRFAKAGAPLAKAHPKLVELVATALREPHEERRIATYRAIQDYVLEQVLVTPLYVPQRSVLRRREVSGVRLGPDLYHVDWSKLRDDRRPPR